MHLRPRCTTMAQRSVIRVVPATPTGPLLRLIGGLDCKGKGTDHPLLEVGPVCLLDRGSIVGKDQPKFGMHPHYGLIAVTYPFDGAFTDGDNINGDSGHVTRDGMVYVVSAGQGVCHQEYTVEEGTHHMIQTIFRIPKDKLAAHPVPSIGRAVPADMPTVTLEGGATFQIVLGANAGAASPANVATLPRCAFLRVRVPPGRTATVPLDPDLTEGYALVVSGVGRFAGDAADVSPQSGLVLFGPGEGLVVTNADAGAALDAVVVAGAPLAEPWVKTLGLNGFIVTESEAAGDRMMARIMERQMEFTYKDLEGLP
uniref:Pirin N-terminal domain-containing protein n=1 Tax=Eutreptiella gymnastica TaxID=73025 RepID=A0A7S4LI68_9EUGL